MGGENCRQSFGRKKPVKKNSAWMGTEYLNGSLRNGCVPIHQTEDRDQYGALLTLAANLQVA
jgi:hypothetical protein